MAKNTNGLQRGPYTFECTSGNSYTVNVRPGSVDKDGERVDHDFNAMYGFHIVQIHTLGGGETARVYGLGPSGGWALVQTLTGTADSEKVVELTGGYWKGLRVVYTGKGSTTPFSFISRMTGI